MMWRRWTPEEDARLLQLRDAEYKTFKQIDVILDRPAKASGERYRLLMRRRGAVPRAPFRTSRTLLRDAIRAHEEARAAAGHTTTTALLLNDPPPGRSALDQKMGTSIR